MKLFDNKQPKERTFYDQLQLINPPPEQSVYDLLSLSKPLELKKNNMQMKKSIKEKFDTASVKNEEILKESLLIGKLVKGDLFGEIGLLTNLRRTSTVITNESCLANRLDEFALEKIKKKFPSIFMKIYENMYSYLDEDMMQRIKFTENIPFLRRMT